MMGIDGTSGTGSGGCTYDSGALSFPCVPYGNDDFNCCDAFGNGNCGGGATCYTGSCGIDSYSDVDQVRNCRLVGLGDIAVGLDYPRQKVREFFDDLIGIGVAGNVLLISFVDTGTFPAVLFKVV